MRLFAIPAIFAAGALIGRLALRMAPTRLAVDLAQPLVVATAWGGYGTACLAVLFATLSIALLLYLRELRAADPPSMRDILLASGASLIAGLLWLPLFSSDVYAYAAYGEMARLGLDPFSSHPLPGGNALFAAALWQWQPAIPPCVYGEAFVQLGRAIVTATNGLPVATTLNVFRVASCAAFLYCVVGIARLAGNDAAGRRAALTLGCNPVALWAAIEGHNDTLMLAVVLAGIVVSARYARFGVLLATLGALIKAPALLAGAALAAREIFTTRSIKALTGFLVGAALVAALSQPLVAGIVQTANHHGRYAPYASVQSLGLVATLLLVAAVLWRLRAFDAAVDRWCVGALVIWALIPNPYPWYSLWILPIAALARDGRVRGAVVAVSAAALFRYIPDSIGAPAGVFALGLGAVATAAYLPLFRRSA